MSFPQGLNFRRTLAFTTDVSPEDPELLGTADYPRVTAQGNTVGFESDAPSRDFRDRQAGNDRRIVGDGFNDGDSENFNYRIDLPSAGVYSLRSASGDGNYTSSTRVEILDDATSLGLISQTNTTAANSFRDATDTEYTAANWPGSNTAVNKTFASTICRLKLTRAASHLAHFSIDGPAASGQRFFLSPN